MVKKNLKPQKNNTSSPKKGSDNSTINTGLFNFLIFLLVLLIIGAIILFTFKVFSQPNNYDYSTQNGVYHLSKERIFGINVYRINVSSSWGNYSYAFRNRPEDLEKLYLEPGIRDKLNRPNGVRVLYVTRDVGIRDLTNNYDIIALAPLEQILGSGAPGLYRLNLINAYTSFFKKDTDIATCNKVNKQTAVIYLKLGTENKVYSQNDCVIIEGKDSEGLIMAAEKLAYHTIGVF